MSVDEHTIELAGSPVFYRRAPAPGTATAPNGTATGTATARREPVYLHGIPTSSDDWTPFLELTGGLAPDLIGFGRSGKGGHLDYSLDGLASFLERLLDRIGIATVHLVAHQWATPAALVFAERNPSRVGRLVLIDPLPLDPGGGFVWPAFVRAWRRPLVGELLMGATTKGLFGRALRTGGAWPDARIDALWKQFDQGTQRAILRLCRATTADRLRALARASRDVLDTSALIIWGGQDPWLPATLAQTSFPGASLDVIPNAGHWPWLEDPDVVKRVAAFLHQPNS